MHGKTIFGAYIHWLI